MEINKLIENKKELEKYYNNYIKRNLIIKSQDSLNLKKAHLKKAQHNLEFIQNINNIDKFSDWVIVSLYYSLYHSFLALIENKGYSSKNHNATIIFVLKHYIQINNKELELLNSLKVTKEDAKLYTILKEKRNKASYSTQLDLDFENIEELILEVKNIYVKIEEIILNN